MQPSLLSEEKDETLWQDLERNEKYEKLQVWKISRYIKKIWSIDFKFLQISSTSFMSTQFGTSTVPQSKPMLFDNPEMKVQYNGTGFHNGM